jgi:NTE family protein
MNQKRVAIACQGGGSQCAFVAGALKTLMARGVHHRFKIVGLSGTSGGALTAALAWTGLLTEAKGDPTPIGDRIVACWNDLTAQSPQEIALDAFCTSYVRQTGKGFLPSIATSPSTPQFQLWSEAIARSIGRPEFTDLRALLVKHIDFEALPSLIQPDSPVLLAGAVDVLEGSFKIFSSRRREITVESLLASAAIPTLFPAVQADGHAYWDGIFSSNPPITGFLREPLMGAGMVPQEIWIIQVNPARYRTIPQTPDDILDRRNHLAGNLSLQHELQVIEMVNLMLREGALTDAFCERFGLKTRDHIAVRFIRMSDELQQGLDYPTKLSRQPGHIAALIADGESQANSFLASLQDAEGVEAVMPQMH